MHIVGLLGMTRRVYTYHAGLGWDVYNLIETSARSCSRPGSLLIAVNLVWSSRRGEPAGRDPFHGGTLEWTIPSPPPHYNFAVIPTVASPYPNWDERPRRGLRRLEPTSSCSTRGHETTVLDRAATRGSTRCCDAGRVALADRARGRA